MEAKQRPWKHLLSQVFVYAVSAVRKSSKTKSWVFVFYTNIFYFDYPWNSIQLIILMLKTRMFIIDTTGGRSIAMKETFRS